MAFGLGMSTRFSVNFHKVAALIAAAFSTVGLVGLLIVEHVHDVDPQLLLESSRYLTVAIIVWLIILGVGMYKGMSELTPSSSDDQR